MNSVSDLLILSFLGLQRCGEVATHLQHWYHHRLAHGIFRKDDNMEHITLRRNQLKCVSHLLTFHEPVQLHCHVLWYSRWEYIGLPKVWTLFTRYAATTATRRPHAVPVPSSPTPVQVI